MANMRIRFVYIVMTLISCLAFAEERANSVVGPDVLVAAHRGGYVNDKADNAPENSLANLELAIRKGFDVYETDIQRTSDGIFVIMHDETIERETNGSGRISEMTFAQVRQLKKRFRDGSLSAEPVATLERLLKAGRGRILFKPDLKKGVVQHFVELAKLIQQCGMQDQVFLRTKLADRRLIAKSFEQGCPKVEVMFKVDTAEQAKAVIKQFQPATLQMNLAKGESVSKDKADAIAYAASQGVVVETHVYSDKKQWDRLAELGVKMFHTASPDAVLAHLEEKGLHSLSGGALTGKRPRVIVSTDIGGSDPDDYQSLVHLLLYADVLDIEGLVASPPHAGRVEHINEVLDAYEADYAKLTQNSGYKFPEPKHLRAVSVQGAAEPAPAKGWNQPTDGSRLIIDRAKATDERPLWILVWGSMTDVAQALHDEPSIKPQLRVYSIGSWNTRQDEASRNYVFKNHSDLWWIECDTTFRGMYTGGNQQGEYGNREFVSQHVRGHGALGDLFWQKKRDIKMGDTPSVLYLLNGRADDPSQPHWGGAFRRFDHGPNYFRDDQSRSLKEQNLAGAKTVNRWRSEFLNDWKARMDWLH